MKTALLVKNTNFLCNPLPSSSFDTGGISSDQLQLDQLYLLSNASTISDQSQYFTPLLFTCSFLFRLEFALLTNVIDTRNICVEYFFFLKIIKVIILTTASSDLSEQKSVIHINSVHAPTLARQN